MKLFHKQYSSAGEALIILHGLFGNQGNWAMHAKQLAQHYSVYAFDARNHGRSPWRDSMTYEEMAADVSETMAALDLPRAHFLAHSMGGKTAMQLALQDAEKVHKLVVVDIVPVTYPSGPYAVLDGLLAVDLSAIQSRREAEQILAQYINEEGVRDFLLSNLRRTEAGAYAWRFNLAALAQHYPTIKAGLTSTGPYAEEMLFIKGGNSDYIQEEYREQTFQLFPKAKIKVVENAGHWVHSEKPAALLKIVENYLARPD